MKISVVIGFLFLSLTSFAGVHNLSCVLNGDALDTLDISADSSKETIKVTYSFMSGETYEFESEVESDLFSNSQLVSYVMNFVAFNGDSFSFGGAHYNSALVVMNEVTVDGSRDVLVSAGGTVYTGSCK